MSRNPTDSIIAYNLRRWAQLNQGHSGWTTHGGTYGSRQG